MEEILKTKIQPKKVQYKHKVSVGYMLNLGFCNPRETTSWEKKIPKTDVTLHLPVKICNYLVLDGRGT